MDASGLEAEPLGEPVQVAAVELQRAGGGGPVAPLPGGLGLRAATDAFQLALIEQTLAAHEGNWAATARALELDSGNLHRLAKRLGLKA